MFSEQVTGGAMVESIPIARKLREMRHLAWLAVSVRVWNLVEFTRSAFLYYRYFSFFKVDLTLLLSYLLQNPFSMSKRYLQEKGEKEVYAYGETPLTTLGLIAREAKITAKDHVLELGCGRGRTCFWLNKVIGSQVTGIDFVPTFINKANWVKRLFDAQGVHFIESDFLKADLTGVSVIYLYGSCMARSEIEQLVERLKEVPSGTKIITVSYPLTDYSAEPLFEVMKVFPATFAWGTGDVFVQYRL